MLQKILYYLCYNFFVYVWFIQSWAKDYWDKMCELCTYAVKMSIIQSIKPTVNAVQTKLTYFSTVNCFLIYIN